jgi:molecular chaperone GrpE
MLKMNKKKSTKEIDPDNKEELVKDEEITQPDIESQEQSEKPSEEKIEEKKEPTIEEKFNDANDKFLRLHAEFDNYRKRTIKERIEFSKMASEDIIKSFLPVFDDLERALKSMDTVTDVKTISEGVTLIYNKFKNILTQKGLEEIKTDDGIFNTDYHEAIANVPAETEEIKGKIIDVVEKGYLLNGKVIRFAKVVVAN